MAEVKNRILGKKSQAGSTILEVVVSLAAFVVISAVFCRFIINIKHAEQRIIHTNQEMQELLSLYYAGNVLKKTSIGEEAGILFFPVVSSRDNLANEGDAAEALTDQAGFVLAGSLLFYCTEHEGSDVLYVLEPQPHGRCRAASTASRSQAAEEMKEKERESTKEAETEKVETEEVETEEVETGEIEAEETEKMEAEGMEAEETKEMDTEQMDIEKVK